MKRPVVLLSATASLAPATPRSAGGRSRSEIGRGSSCSSRAISMGMTTASLLAGAADVSLVVAVEAASFAPVPPAQPLPPGLGSQAARPRPTPAALAPSQTRAPTHRARSGNLPPSSRIAALVTAIRFNSSRRERRLTFLSGGMLLCCTKRCPTAALSRLPAATLGLVTSPGARGRHKPLAKPTLIGTRNLITQRNRKSPSREARALQRKRVDR